MILALEEAEALRTVKFANEKTVFLINEKHIPYLGGPSETEVFKKIEKNLNNVYLAQADKICREELGSEIVSGVYILGIALSNELIPFKKEILLGAIKKVIKEKHFSLNKKALELGYKNAGQA